jgi:hypothetical protein
VYVNAFRVKNEETIQDQPNSSYRTLSYNAFKISSTSLGNIELGKTNPSFIQATSKDKELVELNWKDYKLLWPKRYLCIDNPTQENIIECIGKIRSEVRESCCHDYLKKVEHVIKDFAKQHWPRTINGVVQPEIIRYDDVRNCFLGMGAPSDPTNPDGRFYLAYQLVHGLYAAEQHYSPEKYSERWLKEFFNCVLDRDRSSFRNTNLAVVSPIQRRDPLSTYLRERRITKLHKSLITAIEASTNLSLLKTAPKTPNKKIVFTSEGSTLYGQWHLCKILNKKEDNLKEVMTKDGNANSVDSGGEGYIQRLEEAIGAAIGWENASPTQIGKVLQRNYQQLLTKTKKLPPIKNLIVENKQVLDNENSTERTPHSQGEISALTSEVRKGS